MPDAPFNTRTLVTYCLAIGTSTVWCIFWNLVLYRLYPQRAIKGDMEVAKRGSINEKYSIDSPVVTPIDLVA